MIVPLVFTSRTLVFPNCMVFDAPTLAPYPIAVALVNAAVATSAPLPIAVLFAGDFVCLDFRETEDPTVVVWYHEESGEFSPVTKTVAQNISEFFGMLKE